MNQIIVTAHSNIEITKNTDKSNKYIFKILFYISLILSISITVYYTFYRYDLYKSEKVSKELLNNFNITTLYNNNSNYTANFISQEISNYSNYSIIGVIEINKLGIIYPILSEISKEHLKISPCRFYGPNPNEIGNLCIAAHNYKNKTFFSNLSDLENGDIITIYSIDSSYVDYMVYNIYRATSSDLSCINQDTNGKRIITLVTCDSLDNNYRTIVKAKEI